MSGKSWLVIVVVAIVLWVAVPGAIALLLLAMRVAPV
jgi:hypothetical protein